MCLIFVNARKASHPQVKLLSPRSFIKQQVFWINKMNFKSNIKTFLFRSYCCTSCYSNVIYEIKMTTVANILPLFILFYAWSSIMNFLSQQKVTSTSYRFSKLFFLYCLNKMQMWSIFNHLMKVRTWKNLKFEINHLRYER